MNIFALLKVYDTFNKSCETIREVELPEDIKAPMLENLCFGSFKARLDICAHFERLFSAVHCAKPQQATARHSKAFQNPQIRFLDFGSEPLALKPAYFDRFEAGIYFRIKFASYNIIQACGAMEVMFAQARQRDAYAYVISQNERYKMRTMAYLSTMPDHFAWFFKC